MLFSVPNNGEELFFSEYYEPVSSGYPKYIEIYNSTIDKIDLSDYEVWYVDGANQWDGSGIASSFPVTGKLIHLFVFAPSLKRCSQNEDGFFRFESVDVTRV